jgi:hypothetical protein
MDAWEELRTDPQGTAAQKQGDIPNYTNSVPDCSVDEAVDSQCLHYDHATCSGQGAKRTVRSVLWTVTVTSRMTTAPEMWLCETYSPR